MTNKVRFTYRLTSDLFQKISKEAKKRGISVNAEINRVLFEYYKQTHNNN